MRFVFLCIFSILNITLFCQSIQFMKVNEIISNQGLCKYVYKVEVYNNTNRPICIPVSLSFGYTVNLYDTVDVVSIYPAVDSSVIFSLYYTKSDIEGSSARYPAIPVILNPCTYLSTYIIFKKPKGKSMFLELKYSYDKNLDFYKIWTSFENEPQYKWMDDLNFVDKKYPIQ